MTTKPPSKAKYLTNKELLIEIGKSKASYGYFLSPDYETFDVVVSSLEFVTKELLETTILSKASKLSSKLNVVNPKSIDPESIVFRVMTDSHLPPEEDEKKRKKSSNGEWVAKPNFPPYKHYIMKNGEPMEVGRSHWKNGLHNGEFCITHGKMSNKLAEMFMLLTDKFALGGSFRNYCVDQETQALTQRGWLGYDDITEDDIILSYDDGKLKWSRIKSIYRNDSYDGKMFKLTVTGMDALVTPHHKFVTDKGIKEIELLLEKDRIILTGEPVEDGNTTYSDAFVELVGWAVTEGNYYFPKRKQYCCQMTISQKEGKYADRIRSCLKNLDVRYSESYIINSSGNTMVRFSLTKDISNKILEVAENRVLSMPFILSLTQHQRVLLINTMVDGDGWRRINETKTEENYLNYSQKDVKHLDSFLALCTLAGYRTSHKQRDIISFGNPTKIYIVNIFTKRMNYAQIENIDFHGGKRNGRNNIGKGKIAHPNEPTIDYQGKVWCPETEYGSFMAKRNGTIYLTGNSYIDEMKCHALMHLSQVGLQFDESRSSNPFSFFTQVVKHCFTRILNLEKRNQNIRDDLLIMAGVNPSFTRQIDNDMDQKDETKTDSEEKKPPTKRGRKPKAKVVTE